MFTKKRLLALTIFLIILAIFLYLLFPKTSVYEPSAFYFSDKPREHLNCKCLGYIKVIDERPVDGSYRELCRGIVYSCEKVWK